ncbi:VOC family protein [Nocardia carnea]|uniref:VOC family protein n=1 Tax=Nocardia carnea TaxID=37328 RepID=A0ABW7TMM2_9NOCA|nr:VOC family protein [Nocardia carnea]
MTTPNMFIVYVRDAAAAARFYGDLFEMKPVFETPRFIAFDLGGGIQLAVWSGVEEGFSFTGSRTSELCLALPGGPEEIDNHFRKWVDKGVDIVAEPYDEVFGRTFVVADPDGNLIRVAPVD